MTGALAAVFCFQPPLNLPSLCLSFPLSGILIWSVLPSLVNIYISAFKCCLYMALICYLTHTETGTDGESNL